MLRISGDNLTQKDDLYYYSNSPFYGYAYQFNGKGIFQAIYKVINGKKIDILDEENIAEPREVTISSHHLNTEEVNEDGEPIYTFQEQPFEGIAYMFNKEGLLLSLSYIDEGEEYTYSTYYLSGLLKTKEALFEDYEWYESGQLKKKKIRNSKFHLLILHLSEHGRIQLVNIKEGYNNLEELELIAFDDVVRLSGYDMNDKVFHQLSKKQSYNTIKELSIRHSNITGKLLFSLMHNNISRLFLEGNYLIDQNDVDRIQESFPSCHIIFSPIEKH